MMDDAQVSRMMFKARESVEMWADVVEAKTGQVDHHNRNLVKEIDEYRASRGWNPNGFGGENGNRI